MLTNPDKSVLVGLPAGYNKKLQGAHLTASQSDKIRTLSNRAYKPARAAVGVAAGVLLTDAAVFAALVSQILRDTPRYDLVCAAATFYLIQAIAALVMATRGQRAEKELKQTLNTIISQKQK